MLKKSSLFTLLILLTSLTLYNCASSPLSSSSVGSAGDGDGIREWTFLVYMGADNTLSDAGLDDINEMEEAGSNDDVAIVVQAEFSSTYNTSSLTLPTNTVRLLVSNDNDTSGPNLDAATSMGSNVDMGNPTTLSDFITWGIQNYPAEHYALIIWDHGDGWRGTQRLLTRGAVQDSTSGSFMSLPDLASAVRTAGTTLDIVDFDACLMAMYEVAYEFSGLTNYMVLSEETEPGAGNPYDDILTHLKANPNMTPAQLSEQIVTDYDTYFATDSRMVTTLSAIDMSQISALDTKVTALSAALAADSSTSAVVAAAQDSTQFYTLPENHDLYDLASYLVTNLSAGAAKTAAQDIIDLFPNLVIANATNHSSVADSNGLAIYLPTVDQTTSGDLADYALLACNLTTRASADNTWGSYVEDLIADNGGVTVTSAAGGFGVRIDWETCDADVDLYVGEPSTGVAAPGDVSAPFNGTTTSNGFFSQDSAVSGSSTESYQSSDEVSSGDYYFLVNYYDDGETCSSATVHFYIIDPANDIDDWTEVTTANGFATDADSPVTMSSTSPWPNITLANINDSTDWWLPLTTTRSLSGPSFGVPEVGGTFSKRNQAIFRYGKGSRL